MWLLCIAVWLLSGAVKGVWDSFGVIPCDSNAMGWSVKTTSTVLLKAVRNKRVPRLPLSLQGKVWVSCNLGTPLVNLLYISIYMQIFFVGSLRKVYPFVPRKRRFVEIEPKNLGTRGYNFGPSRR